MEGKVVMLLVTLFGVCSATSVIVGGNTGWTIPKSSSFYSSWATKQSFQVGDVLVFNFPVGAHTVAEVSKPNYDSCNVAKTVGPVLTTGPANITLKSASTHYFVCTITGHCSAGQKLAVTVGGSKAVTPVASPKTSPSPASSPSSSSSGGPADAGTTSPPSPNSAAFTGSSLLSLFFIIAAALVF